MTEDQLELASRYRDRLVKCAMPPGTPEYMLQDLTHFSIAYPARLVECNRCGLVSRDPRPSRSSVLEIFARDTYHPDWLDAAFRDYHAAFLARMPELIRQIGREASVLEVGSYVGGFLAAAHDSGWRAVGVDVGRQVSVFSRRRGLSVFTGTLAEKHFPDEHFDAVFAWVCFDQMPDPQGLLSEIRRVLKPRGWLYIQVPNGEYVKVVKSVLDRVHLDGVRRTGLKALAYTGLAGFPYQLGYTPATLRRLLTECGFHQVGIRHRFNVSDGAPGRALPKPREQMEYVRRIDRVTKGLYYASLSTLVKGPWIEAASRKA